MPTTPSSLLAGDHRRGSHGRLSMTPTRETTTGGPGTMQKWLLVLLLTIPSHVRAADYPEPTQGDFPIRDFRFQSGGTLPELRIHYRTLGKPARGEDGKVRNAVLILHGTIGSGAQFLRPEFAGELFGEGQPLDASR